MTYISWFIDIGLYLEDSVMYKAVTLAGGIREPLLTSSSFMNIFGIFEKCHKEEFPCCERVYPHEGHINFKSLYLTAKVICILHNDDNIYNALISLFPCLYSILCKVNKNT